MKWIDLVDILRAVLLAGAWVSICVMEGMSMSLALGCGYVVLRLESLDADIRRIRIHGSIR